MPWPSCRRSSRKFSWQSCRWRRGWGRSSPARTPHNHCHRCTGWGRRWKHLKNVFFPFSVSHFHLQLQKRQTRRSQWCSLIRRRTFCWWRNYRSWSRPPRPRWKESRVKISMQPTNNASFDEVIYFWSAVRLFMSRTRYQSVLPFTHASFNSQTNNSIDQI